MTVGEPAAFFLQLLLPLLVPAVVVSVATVACGRGKPGAAKQQPPPPPPAAAAAPPPPTAPPAVPPPLVLAAARQVKSQNKTKSLEEKSAEDWNGKCDRGEVWANGGADDDSGEGLPVPDPGKEARVVTDEEFVALVRAGKHKKPADEANTPKVSDEQKEETPPVDDKDSPTNADRQNENDSSPSDHPRPKILYKRNEDKKRHSRVTGNNFVKNMEKMNKKQKEINKEKRKSTKIDSHVFYPADEEGSNVERIPRDKRKDGCECSGNRHKKGCSMRDKEKSRSDREDRRDDKKRCSRRDKDGDREDTNSGPEGKKVDSRKDRSDRSK